MAEGWGDAEIARIVAFVDDGGYGQRNAPRHPAQCACPLCAAEQHCGGGRCPNCAYPLDNHSLTKGSDTIVCPLSERDIVV